MNTLTKKKKVLLLITKSNWGGAQRYVYDLATSLPKAEYEVVVAAGGNGPLIEKLRAADITVLPIAALQRDISIKKESRAVRAIYHIIRDQAPDILHINSSKAGVYGALIGRWCRVSNIIFTAHGWAFNEDRPAYQRFLFKTFHWLTVLLTHRTITVSNALKTQMNWSWAQAKMTTIHLGRAETSYVPKASARAFLASVTPALQPYLSDIWTMSIGELHPVKQHAVTIEAIAALRAIFPTLRHLIIGSGQLYHKLEQQIRQLHLQQHVFLLGHIDEAAQYIAAADIFIIPSRSEALGYVAIEAAQTGVATIASNVGGLPEVIEDDVTGLLVPSSNPIALAAALTNYLEHDMVRHQHAAAAAVNAQKFTLANMVSATEQVYKG